MNFRPVAVTAISNPSPLAAMRRFEVTVAAATVLRRSQPQTLIVVLAVPSLNGNPAVKTGSSR